MKSQNNKRSLNDCKEDQQVIPSIAKWKDSKEKESARESCKAIKSRSRITNLKARSIHISNDNQ
jgi:hypothetical protein